MVATAYSQKKSVFPGARTWQRRVPQMGVSPNITHGSSVNTEILGPSSMMDAQELGWSPAVSFWWVPLRRYLMG